jgi:hypothetical protein
MCTTRPASFGTLGLSFSTCKPTFSFFRKNYAASPDSNMRMGDNRDSKPSPVQEGCVRLSNPCTLALCEAISVAIAR